MSCNESGVDRAIRVVLGLAIAWCPLHSIFGMRTCKVAAKV
jgi:hypothetical protein